MEISCKQCGKIINVTSEGFFSCPYCKENFTHGDSRKNSANFPWDSSNKENFFRAFFKTLYSVLFRPSDFFSTMPKNLGYTEPIIFAILLYSFGFFLAGLNFIYIEKDTINFILSSLSYSRFNRVLFDTSMMSPYKLYIMALPLTPILCVIIIFFKAIIFHLLLKFSGAANNKLDVTYGVICFAKSATKIFNIIPIVGSLMDFAWSLVISVIGFKVAHNTSYSRVIFAISIPLILLFILFSLFIIGIVVMVNNHQTLFSL